MLNFDAESHFIMWHALVQCPGVWTRGGGGGGGTPISKASLCVPFYSQADNGCNNDVRRMFKSLLGVWISL